MSWQELWSSAHTSTSGPSTQACLLHGIMCPRLWEHQVIPLVQCCKIAVPACLPPSGPPGTGSLRQVPAVAVRTPGLERTAAGVLLADAVANKLAM